MEELFVRPRALMRMREGPLGVCIDTFIDSLAAKGYSRDSRRRAAWLVGDFSRWLDGRGVAAAAVAEDLVDAFLRGRRRRRAPRAEDRSTLLRLLNRLIEPTAGRILIDGVDIQSFTLASIRAQIGIVSQDVVLFDDTIGKNIAFGRQQATQDEIVSAARSAYAHDFIERLPQGYETIVGERGVKLSGGERQRLAIARAILRDPPLLILDEATSALDSESERMVQLALNNLMQNRTTLVIAHRLSTIQRADRIVVLDRGTIVETGTHEELLRRRGQYQRLHAMQFQDAPNG